MKESRYFIPKIIAGYLLLAAMCAAMIAYIYHKVDSSTAVDPVLSAIESRNAMIDRTLVGLYRAESRAQMILAGDDSYIALYDEDVEDSLACIDSLKNTVILSDDPVRAARLDTVSMLVNRKRRELLRLAQGAARRQRREPNHRAQHSPPGRARCRSAGFARSLALRYGAGQHAPPQVFPSCRRAVRDRDGYDRARRSRTR